jgi:hypothetical protein
VVVVVVVVGAAVVVVVDIVILLFSQSTIQITGCAIAQEQFFCCDSYGTAAGDSLDRLCHLD